MNEMTFQFGEVAQLLIVAFTTGTLFQQVRVLASKQKEDVLAANKALTEVEARATERLTKLEHRQEVLEGRFVRCIEDLNTSISNLTSEIRTSIAVQDNRILHIEQDQKQ